MPAVGGEPGGIDGHVLAVGVVGEVAGDAVAHAEALHQLADLHHGPGRLVPGAAREGVGLLHLVAVGVLVGGHVARADSARFDLDQHLAVGDLRGRDLADLVLPGRHNERCSHLSVLSFGCVTLLAGDHRHAEMIAPTARIRLLHASCCSDPAWPGTSACMSGVLFS